MVLFLHTHGNVNVNHFISPRVFLSFVTVNSSYDPAFMTYFLIDYIIIPVSNVHELRSMGQVYTSLVPRPSSKKKERVWEIASLVCAAVEFMECNYIIQANLVAYYNMLYS